jgi:hypothetical protein
MKKNGSDEFKTIFSRLERYAKTDLWSDERIEAGANWEDEINDATERAFAAAACKRRLSEVRFYRRKGTALLLKSRPHQTEGRSVGSSDYLPL